MVFAKALRYVLAGGAAALIDLEGFRGLLFLNLPLGLSATCSWLIAAAANYGFSSRYVFNRAFSRKRAALFVVGAAFGLSINVSVTLFSMHVYEIPPMWAKLAGIGTAFIFNFTINLLWVFR